MSHSTHRRSALPPAVASLLLCLASQETQAARPPIPFTIFGYRIGNPGQRELYEFIRDAGFDVLVAGDARSIADAQQVASHLDAIDPRADGSRLRGIFEVDQNGCASVFKNPTPVECRGEILDTVEWFFNQYPTTTFGWSVSDEPIFPATLDSMLVETDIIDDVFSTTTIPFVNLLPIAGMYKMEWVGPADTTICEQTRDNLNDFNRASYQCYVDAYLDHFTDPELPAPILSNDHYPFAGQTPQEEVCPPGTEHLWPHNDIFLNLTVMRNKAKEYSTPARRLPYWQIIQISQWKEHAPNFTCTFEPSESRVRFHAMAALAYGATGIGYWSLVEFEGSTADNRYGPGIFEDIDPTGNTFTKRQPRYDFVASLNGELRQLGNVLINLDHVGVVHRAVLDQKGIGSQLLGALGHPSGLVAAMSSIAPDDGLDKLDAMVSHFRDGTSNDHYLLVQNKSLVGMRDVTITLNGTWDGAERKDKFGDGYVPVELEGQPASFTLELEPGDAELIHLFWPLGGGCGEPPCEIEPAASRVSWSATPNPARGRVTVNYLLPERTKVSLDILDIAGRRVASLVDAEQEAGAHSFQWDPTLSAGTFFFRLRTGTQVVGKKLLIVN